MSGAIEYEAELEGDAPEETMRELVNHVDRIAEIPNSIRQGTEVRLTSVRISGSRS